MKFSSSVDVGIFQQRLDLGTPTILEGVRPRAGQIFL